MGGGVWNVNTYDETVDRNAAAGRSSFDYSDQVQSGHVNQINSLLDPLTVAGPTSSFAGQIVREVRVTAEHPDPTAIAVVLDVTASNGAAARAAHQKLPQLLGVLQRKGYVTDPQINFCAVGDAYCDRFPLQVGQFESDNRLDDQLSGIILEGGGGGQRCETYELAAYYLARHTYLEQFDLTGKKGFVFFVGDEKPYDMLRRDFIMDRGYSYGRHTLASLTGDQLERDLSTAEVFAELKKRYHVFFLFQARGSYQPGEMLPTWQRYLGENALTLDDPSAVCEVIAGILAIMGGGLNVDEAVADLKEVGTDPSALRAATKALATVQGGRVAKATGSLPDLPDDGATGTTRL